MRSTVRMTGAAKNTVARFQVEIRQACAAYHDKHMRNLQCKILEVDEVWTFTKYKQANVPADLKDMENEAAKRKDQRDNHNSCENGEKNGQNK